MRGGSAAVTNASAIGFDRLIDGLAQNAKLPEVATKAPPVGWAAPCQLNDWQDAKFHAGFHKPAVISRAAATPLLQAHWKL